MVDINSIWENGFSNNFLGKKLTGDRRAFLFMKDTNPVDPDYSYSNRGVISPNVLNRQYDSENVVLNISGLGELGVTKGKKNSLGLSSFGENIGLDFGFKSSELIQNIKDFINDLIQQIKDLISNYLDFLMKNWEIVLMVIVILLLIVGFAVLKVYTL